MEKVATTTNLTLHLLSRENIRLCLEGCESPGCHWLKSHTGNWFAWGSQQVKQLGDKHECIGCGFNPMEKTLVKMGIFPKQLWRVLNHHLQQYLWNCSLPVFLHSASLLGKTYPSRQLEDQLFCYRGALRIPSKRPAPSCLLPEQVNAWVSHYDSATSEAKHISLLKICSSKPFEYRKHFEATTLWLSKTGVVVSEASHPDQVGLCVHLRFGLGSFMRL